MTLPDLTRRRDLARPLNEDEFDANTDNFDQRLIAIEDSPSTAVSISSITASGDQMTITLSDASTRIVTMPYRRLNPRVWAPAAMLSIDDVFPMNGSLYAVLYPHTAASEFVSGANDGLGHNYYFELLPNPGNSLPEAGELGQVLVKLSGTNYAVGWRFLDSLYVTFSPSSDSDLVSTNVADALEELEAKIASAVGAVSFTALQISYSPSSASGLSSITVEDALDELAERVIGFADLSGVISPVQSRPATVTALGTTGTVSLDPSLGDVFSITPTGAVTLNAASAPAGAKITIIVATSGTSSYNVTPGANFKSIGALATGTVSGKVFTLSFVGDGINLNETARTVAM